MIHLLNNSELEKSDVVANNRMNRERNLVGINSYKKDIGIDPIQFIQQKMASQNFFHWLDLCCGKGKALLQAAAYFNEHKNTIHFQGIDLVDYFEPSSEKYDHLELICGSIMDFIPKQSYDLITCVHGLHYIGDKLKMIEKYSEALKDDGLFVTHLDLNNIKSSTLSDIKKLLIEQFKKPGFNYNSRTKILTCTGKRAIDFKLSYKGANDQAGPNYTGQEAVDSYYE